ncbi:arsenate reductase/protein-tyrosine-phosphatase family protein [Helicobacter vulpis]|uniref:arsenate reductase/protein-tyrosine-phosphatase family protein n=1 Tax=Helicobacter vulpis TaxID=2316076 RepID=UPI0022875790|nr:hypothetical protein [Helicobacter vulpis]
MSPQNLLFLCLGNICRSMLARGIAQHLIEMQNLKVRVDGAGISSFHQGEPPHPPIIRLAQEHGLDISHFKSKPITQELAIALIGSWPWITAMYKPCAT